MSALTRMRSLDRYAAWAVQLLCLAEFTVFGWYCLPEYDSLGFEALYLRYNGGSSAASWDAWLSFARELWLGDNIRIGQLVSPFVSLYMPRWMWALCVGGFMWCILSVTLQMTRPAAGRRFFCASVLWGALILFLPWRNCLLTQAYSLNYLLSGAIVVAFAACWLKCLSVHTASSFKFLTLVLAVLLGWTHEGFALPLAAGCLVWMLSCRLRDTKVAPVAWVAWGVLCCVALGTALCPGLIGRLMNEVSDSGTGIDHSPGIRIYADVCLSLLSLVMVLILAMVPSGRRILKKWAAESVTAVSFTALVGACVLSLMVDHTPRSAFPSQLYAIIFLAAAAMPLLRHIGGRICGVCGAAIVLLVCAHFLHTIKWTRLFASQNMEILARMKNSPGTLYRDIIFPWEVPFTTLYFPSRSTWVDPFTYTEVSALTQCDTIAVVPTAFDTDLSLNPGMEAGDALRKEGHLYTAEIMPEPWQITYMRAIYTDGRPESIPVFCLRFSDGVGRNWTYLFPLRIRSSDISYIYF